MKKRNRLYTYTELGQLIKKDLGQTGSGYLQHVNYRFNIRGQLVYINNSKLANDGHTSNEITDLFGMQLMYDNPDASISGATPSYSGRVSAVKWMTINGTVGTQTNERSYAYSYDKLERYTGSVYAERTPLSTGAFNINTHGFDENNITYDENGNILSLRRNSSTIGNTGAYTTIDRLAYTYYTNNQNQLAGVTDSAANALGFYYKAGNTGSYTYDKEGNLLTDPFKGLTTKYSNLLNKCDSITLTGTGQLTYTYDAGGNLLRKNTYNSGGTLTSSLDYIGGMVFSGGVISYMAMPEGRVLNTGTSLAPEYVITDQQGNARMSFQDNGSGAVQINQENSYYAFGEVLAGSPVPTPTTPNINLYNGGAEWQNEFGNLPDYHQTFFRNYDPETGRFTGADPKPESADAMTDYQYAGNDPVNMNDPMGDLLNIPSNWRSSSPQQFVFSPTSDAFDGGDPSYDTYGIGSGDGYSGPPDYTAQWNAILAGTGFSVGPDGATTYNRANDKGVGDLGDSMITPYIGRDLVFSENGSLLSAVYNPSNGGAISAKMEGNTNNEQGVLYTAQLLHLLGDLPTLDLDAGNNLVDYEGFWGKIWNSNIMRSIIPDDIRVNVAAALVPTVGVGGSVNFDLLTRGKDAGWHASRSLSGRAGAEGGFTFNVGTANYTGDVQSMSFNSITGWGVEGDADFGLAVGAWLSIDPTNRKATWAGSSVGFGPSVGGSGGVSYTWPGLK